MIPGWRAESGVVSERDGRERGRDGADPELPGEPAAHGVELGVETADVREDPARPLEHPLALRRQALVALRAPHDREPDLALEPANARRERRLRDVARGGGAAEMLLPDERHEVREVAEIHPPMIDHVYRLVDPFGLT